MPCFSVYVDANECTCTYIPCLLPAKSMTRGSVVVPVVVREHTIPDDIGFYVLILRVADVVDKEKGFAADLVSVMVNGIDVSLGSCGK